MRTKLSIVVGILIIILTSACSSDEPSSKEFRYLGFEKDVLLPALNERDITFYALGFDTNKNNWELTLNNGTKDIPVTLNTIEETIYGWESVEEYMQKIYCKVPAFGTGNYTLIIKNKITGQLQSDVFLVRDNTFNEVESAGEAFYSLEMEKDYLYYQNTINKIRSNINTNSIEKVVLENTATFNPIAVTYEVNNERLHFTIPKATPVGVYYLAVYYNSGLNSYFEKELIVLEEQKPVITSLNKTAFTPGENLELKGSNFRYTINKDFIPTKGLARIKIETALVFNNGKEEVAMSLGRYEEDEIYNNINSTYTELKYEIPTREKFYVFSDVDKTYFEGEVYLKNGPYKSAPFTVRIDF
ncbi:hypothetical protein [Tenacibaculum finnmarkense]|uniref:hypothetical protein n=1 Tax=Tenacibaculum finnmarkense TaxID=2781243 RepID=UPI001EFB86E9|nr:hypothetical protein [Tenacibaculum finnmarkense]MCG8207859.1 hypothetical protein [Tenacibaculum finnmarkense genomovar finnmarkense]MCG8723921.1 hypothetical protein [Tenacibaculum finnmarkense]MCG8765630.1 hypothetical protein [Tenacibaculum finnmarkense]MCG8778554.1 hypothetical protein [Tenacibaculum finnmarkense]MCM8907045.1 hypothetical protein [Tenacibaculum finnmarkense genomovar finnmarkense]